MNAQLNIAAQIAAAEHAGNAYELAAIARQLLIEQLHKPKPKPTATPARVAGENGAYLTNTERRALGLPIFKDGKIGGRPYRWVLVQFANGFRAVSGFYPRAKNPDDLTPAVIGARARYLLIAGKDRWIDAKAAKRVPRVASVREISEAGELADELARCRRLRFALEAFV